MFVLLKVSVLVAVAAALAPVDRRAMFKGGAAAGLAVAEAPRAAVAAGTRVLVLGGDGFVGSRVCAALAKSGASVTAAARSLDAALPAGVAFTPVDLTKASAASVAALAKGFDTVVSCVGAIGTPADEAVNGASGAFATAAKEAGVQTFVYISVAPEVVTSLGGVGAFEPYFKGKASSERAILGAFGADATILRPTFIYGGDAFGLTPPRVSTAYGRLIEGSLASPPLRFGADITPGIISVALKPPNNVDDVAAAAAAAALGRKIKATGPQANFVDTHDAIVNLARLL